MRGPALGVGSPCCSSFSLATRGQIQVGGTSTALWRLRGGLLVTGRGRLLGTNVVRTLTTSLGLHSQEQQPGQQGWEHKPQYREFVHSNVKLDTTIEDLTPQHIYERERKHFISGTWYIPNPSLESLSEFVENLPKLASFDRILLRSAIFLVTPKVAPWFLDTSVGGSRILEDAMNKIYGSIQTPRAFVGVVDGLPSPETFEKLRSTFGDLGQYAPCEGVTIACFGGKGIEWWDEAGGRHDDSKRGSGILRLVSQRTRHSKGVVRSELDLPLANTLFVNGEKHTLFMTEWKRDGMRTRWTRNGFATPLLGVQISIPRIVNNLVKLNVPLYPLTPPRKAVSCMGNVIREVKDNEGNIIKASTELEAAVPTFLKELNKDQDQAQIQVFAKATPPLRSEPSIREATTTSTPIDPSNTVVQTLDLRELWGGERIYRVMSGGGGWGKKAGLLSLNPATNFLPTTQTESSIFPDPDSEELDLNNTTGLGALIAPNSTVQFFAAKIPHDLPHSPVLCEERGSRSSQVFPPGLETWSQLPSQSMVFGTAMLNEDIYSDSAKTKPQPSSPLVLPGCFGALAEGGSAVRIVMNEFKPVKKEPQTDTRIVNELRIDVPFSTFQNVVPTRLYHLGQQSQEDEGQGTRNFGRAPSALSRNPDVEYRSVNLTDKDEK